MRTQKIKLKKNTYSLCKLRGRVDGGVFCRELSINFSFRLPYHINSAIDILLGSAASFIEVCIHSDSRAAILALSSLTVLSKLGQGAHDLISNSSQLLPY